MRIAIVPWDENITENNIFIEKYAGYVDSHILLKKAFEKRNMEINTIDCYTNLRDVDWFLFFSLDYKWLYRILKLGLYKRMIYCSAEPDVVKPINSREGYTKLLKIFPFILTWNEELIDNKRIFKRNIPYYFNKQFGQNNFNKKKLLINISGNKTSNMKNELYSVREKVISFFEKNYFNIFDLYGTGWNKKKHPSYKGIVESKIEIYHNYKFALSLENTYGVKGYVTEKIFDCFCAGIVPIYKGASDINKYVPKSCYIDYDNFKSIDELAKFLIEMNEENYNKYLNSICCLLDSDIQMTFSSEKFCEYICKVFEKKMPDLKINKRYILYIKYKEMQQDISYRCMILRIKIKKVVLSWLHR